MRGRGKGRRANRSRRVASRRQSGGGKMNQQLSIIRQGPLPDRKDVIFRQPREKAITFTREISFGTVSSAAGAGTYGSVVISLSLCPNFGKLAAVFDTFKIPMIQVRFFPVYTQVNYTGAATPITAAPFELLTAIDYDDGTAPVATDQIRSYQSCMESKFTQYHERSYRPCVANSLYTGTAFTGYGRIRSPWIDCSTSTLTQSSIVQHYGLKYAIGPDTGLGVTIQLYQLQATVILKFKNVVD